MSKYLQNAPKPTYQRSQTALKKNNVTVKDREPGKMFMKAHRFMGGSDEESSGENTKGPDALNCKSVLIEDYSHSPKFIKYVNDELSSN